MLTMLHENINTQRIACIKGFTHNRVSHRGCVAGHPEAAGARVEAGGMSSVHLTAVHGVVLGGEGQWLPFLRSKETNIIK